MFSLIKKTSFIATCILFSCNNYTDPTPIGIEQEEEINVFAKGADISWVTEMEQNGNKFYNSEGQQKDCFQLMKDLGLNSIRLRVWVDPKDHGNWCNQSDLLAKAKRAEELDMDLMIDFHYSDWWADPGQQNIPTSWQGASYEEMKINLAIHTVTILQSLRSNHITPKWVQVGNETNNGFLWDMGKASENPDKYAGLFAAGYDAVKKVFPEAKVIVHLGCGADNETCNWNLDRLKDNGAKWDMIGLSLYPFYNKPLSASETVAKGIDNIKKLSEKYDCDVMIVETGMECADDNGKLAAYETLINGKETLSLLLNECLNNTNGRCKGVFYWEPQCRPSKYRLGAFTEDGYPTIIMDAFKN